MLALGVAVVAHSQSSKPYRVVFDVGGPQEQWEMVLNNVENLQKALGREHVEVMIVAHGKAIGMLQKTNHALAERMTQLSSSGVVFAACQNSMKRANVTKADLLPLATTVDSAVAELVRRQHAGWAYLKAG